MVSMTDPKVSIMPVVPISVLDHYARRDVVKTAAGAADSRFVICALIGAVVDGVIEVRSALPLKNGAEVKDQNTIALDGPFMQSLFQLNQKIFPNERILGWCCTTFQPALFRPVQRMFANGVRGIPVLCLTIDPALKDGTLNPKCFINASCKIGGETEENLFKEVKFDWKCRNPTEKLAVDTMIINRHRQLTPLLEGLPTTLQIDDLQSCAKRPVGRGYTGRETERASFEQTHKHLLQIQAVLKKALDYTNAVIEGKEAEDPVVGRELLNLVQSMPPATTETFDKLFNSTTQDLLMVNYLAKLTQAQVHLMERLHVYVPEVKPSRPAETAA